MSQIRRVSTRFLRKGALIEETYAICCAWDRTLDYKSNLERLREENVIGAANTKWLNEVIRTFSGRFRTVADFEPLVVLAQSGVDLARWRACLLWHIGQQDALFYHFVTEWLYPAYLAERSHIHTEDVLSFVTTMVEGQVASGQLSDYGQLRAGRDLLKMSSDFGLISKGVNRHFRAYHVADPVILYLLHALAEQERNAYDMLNAPVWRLFLLTPANVELAILRLHQFQRLHYQAAGTIVALKLPYPSLLAYAENFAHA